MQHSFDIRPWLKPALTIILGIVLIFKPETLTSTIAWCIGFVIALTGAGKLIQFFSRQGKNIWHLLGAIVLLILGFSILKNPVSLEKRVSQVIGILLLLQAVRSYLDPIAAHEKASSIAMGIMGAVLLLVPLSVPRLVVSVCGVVVLALGIGMVLDVRSGSNHPNDPDNPDVIDAR